MRLSKLLLEVLDGPLRSWASTPVTHAVVGLRCIYVEIEGGFCGLAATPREPLSPSEPIPEHVTPRLLARRADRGPVDAALAWAAVAAATSAWMDVTPGAVSVKAVSRLLGSLRGPVLGLGLVEWAKELLEEYGCRVVSEPAEGLRAAAIGDYALYSASELANALSRSGGLPKILVGLAPSVHSLAAARLGASAVVGVYAPPCVCRKVRRAVEEGRGPRDLARHLVVWASLVPGER